MLDEERALQNIVYTMERGIRVMRSTGQEKFVVIANLAAFTFDRSPGRQLMHKFLSIMQNYYPERLHCFILMDMGWVRKLTMLPTAIDSSFSFRFWGCVLCDVVKGFWLSIQDVD